MKKTHIIILVLIAASIVVLISYTGDLTTYETISSAKQKEGKFVNLIAKVDKLQPVEYDAAKNPNYGVGNGMYLNVAVNTAAIPAELIESELFGHERGAFTGAVARHLGKFEQADGGTLFLDEIGDMPMETQTRLLRALQSGAIRRVGGREEIKVDVRIVAATNKDLEAMIATGQFREDLYYRLNVVPIHMPPLHERADDIEALARHFLVLATNEGLPRHALSADAAELLSRQPWRGNVRELKNFIYRAALLAREDTIDAATLAPLIAQTQRESGEGEALKGGLDAAVSHWLKASTPTPGTVYDAALAAFEAPLFAEILRETGGNQLKAAQILGINRNTLRKRLGELALDPELFAKG